MAVVIRIHFNVDIVWEFAGGINVGRPFIVAGSFVVASDLSGFQNLLISGTLCQYFDAALKKPDLRPVRQSSDVTPFLNNFLTCNLEPATLKLQPKTN